VSRHGHALDQLGQSTAFLTDVVKHIHSDIVPSVLAFHAFTGCDSVVVTYGIGETKAIKVSRQGHALDHLGQSTVDLTDVVKHSTDFMAACYGCKAPCSSITECRQQLWAQKTEVNSSTKTVWFSTNR